MSPLNPKPTEQIAPCADVLPRKQTGPTLPDAQRNILEALLDECTTAMLLDYGLQAIPIPDRSEGAGGSECLAAFIGYAGASVRGALVVIVPMQLLARTHPSLDKQDMTESHAADWSCEFVNQLLGRLKNKLLRHDVVIEVGTAQGVVADRLRLGQSSRTELIVRAYRAEEFELLVCFDLALGPGVVLFAVPPADVAEMPAEGDVVLF